MKPVDHKEREAAATELDTTFFVEAAAGTGKTTALVARIVSAVETGAPGLARSWRSLSRRRRPVN